MTDLSTHNQEFFKESIGVSSKCCANGVWYSLQKYHELAGPDWPNFYDYVNGAVADLPHIQAEMQQFDDVLKYNPRDFGQLAGPNVFPTDLGLVIDSNEYCDYQQWVHQWIGKDINTVSINTGAGHTDGCFVVLGHQTILGIDPLIDYEQHFPGYTVIPVPSDSYINHVGSFNQMKSKVNGKWWVPGQEHNNDFIDFIERYCDQWTGFVQETVFDVNVLALDPDTVCVSGSNPVIQQQLAAQGIETVLIPWRHRFFVDGGLHCITLDLYRE
jgi:hypothetical protein